MRLAAGPALAYCLLTAYCLLPTTDYLPLQVFVQLSQFQKERHIFLHFYQSTDRDRERGTTARLATMKDRKEAGFVYCDAATGALNGMLCQLEHTHVCTRRQACRASCKH